jgi:hypothetical protein
VKNRFQSGWIDEFGRGKRNSAFYQLMGDVGGAVLGAAKVRSHDDLVFRRSADLGVVRRAQSRCPRAASAALRADAAEATWQPCYVHFSETHHGDVAQSFRPDPDGVSNVWVVDPDFTKRALDRIKRP